MRKLMLMGCRSNSIRYYERCFAVQFNPIPKLVSSELQLNASLATTLLAIFKCRYLFVVIQISLYYKTSLISSVSPLNSHPALLFPSSSRQIRES